MGGVRTLKRWGFRRKAATAPVATQAYQEGRADGHRDRVQDEYPNRPVTAEPGTPVARPVRVRRRRGSPLLTLIIAAVVVFGAVMLYLAATNGSFSSGGAVVDHDISTAGTPLRNAESQTGAALRQAGRNLQRDSGTPAS